jgi:hypothetical protein
MDPKRRQQPGNVRKGVPVKPGKSRPPARPKFEQKARNPLIRLRELAAELRVLASELDYGAAELDYGDSSSSSLAPASTSSGEPSSASSGGSSGPPPSSSSGLSIEIERFSFGGIYDELYYWDYSGSGSPTNTKYTQKWDRAGGSGNAALYQVGANATFKSPVISISPAISPTSVDFRVSIGGEVIAEIDSVTISGSSYTLPDITTSAALSTIVDYEEWVLDWEISFDGGTTWESIGSTDPIDFYWIPDAPALSKVFDYGIWFACTQISEAYRDDYANALTVAISDWIYYLPGLGTPSNFMDGSGYVLQVLQIPGGQCLSNAYLLSYLLQSIGVSSGTVECYWAGTSSTTWVTWDFEGTNPTPPCVNFHADAEYGCSNFNANRPARSSGVAKNPRFKFHSMVVIGSTTYDPSYGLTDPASTAAFYNMWNGCSQQMGSFSAYGSCTWVNHC